MSAYRYLFGPVMSRRLGLSLGIDLVPAKTCSFDCIFCQVGRTPRTTVERGEHVPVAAVLAEFSEWVRQGGHADAVTLAGAGEPTLHSRFGEIVRAVGEAGGMPTVLMTNGSLFHLPEVRRDAAAASIVKATVSAWDQPSWVRISRPHPSLSFDAMYEGLRAFAGSFKGELWIEVFVVRGLNDDLDSVRRIAAKVNPIGAARVHLNTVARPPADPDVRAVEASRLLELAALFSPVADVAGGGVRGAAAAAAGESAKVDFAAIVSRHPSSAADLAAAAGLTVEAVRIELERLVRDGTLAVRDVNGVACYEVARPRG